MGVAVGHSVQPYNLKQGSLAMWPTMKSEALLAVGMFAHLHAASF